MDVAADVPDDGGNLAEIKAVEIRAEVRQVKTMVDHTINVVLNLPEECLPQAQVLMGWQGEEVQGVIQVVTAEKEK